MPWRSSATILVLSNELKSTINNCLFAIRPTTSTDYDIHYCLDNVTTPR